MKFCFSMERGVFIRYDHLMTLTILCIHYFLRVNNRKCDTPILTIGLICKSCKNVMYDSYYGAQGQGTIRQYLG